MRWQIALGIVASVATGICLWARAQHTRNRSSSSRHGTSGHTGCKQQSRKKVHRRAYHRLMTEEEYTALIPATELQQLTTFLTTVYQARGWSTSKQQCLAAWQEVVAEAMTPTGGAWTHHVPMEELEPSRLSMLAGILDEKLLGGQLQAWLRQQPGKQPVAFQPISWSVGPDDWFANFFQTKNTVALKRTKWTEAALQVTPAQPANYEGIQCTTRLEVLAHTLAHELIHALVYHHFPHIDAHSPAYLPDDRHGPIFRLLSNKLLGHMVEDFKLAGRSMYHA